MKVAVIALLFAASAFAQNPPPGLPAACGPDKASFDIKLDETQHALAQPEPGKARIYFIGEGPYFWLNRIGLDGRWVGANKNESYFSVSVEPGEHHLCARVDALMAHPVRFAHFTAEAGSVYYFDAQFFDSKSGVYLLFGALDSDQARYQIATSPLSVSTPKTPKK